MTDLVLIPLMFVLLALTVALHAGRRGSHDLPLPQPSWPLSYWPCPSRTPGMRTPRSGPVSPLSARGPRPASQEPPKMSYTADISELAPTRFADVWVPLSASS